MQGRLENPLGNILPGDGYTYEDCSNLGCIQVKRGSGRSLAVNFDFKHEIPYAADDHFHDNFDIAFRCVGGRLRAQVRNLVETGTQGTGVNVGRLEQLDAFADGRLKALLAKALRRHRRAQ